MNNHTHVVLHADKNQAESWTDLQVLERWHKLYSGTLLTQRYMQKTLRDEMSSAEVKMVSATVKVYRQRLFDISWFMRCLNEYIARTANKEDKCTGRFWEGRFKCQALLDEAALIACMAYVDLNPVRANMTKTPEKSLHTSIFHRAESARQHTQPKQLMQFSGNPRKEMPKGLPFVLNEYLQLVDLTGRVIREDKSGYIESNQSPILERIGISESNWVTLTTEFEQHFSHAVGAESFLRAFKENTHCRRISGISSARKLLRTA